MASSRFSYFNRPIHHALRHLTDRRHRKSSVDQEKFSDWGCNKCASFIRILNETLWNETLPGLRQEITFSENLGCTICSGIRTAFERVYDAADFGSDEPLFLDSWPLMNGLQIYSLQTQKSPGHLPQQIYLLPLEAVDRTAVVGRIVDPHIVNIKNIKKWIRCCDLWHGKTCRPTKILFLNDVKDLRVVDVRKGCLAYIDTSRARYLALSYVWGKSEMFLTREDNVRDLEISGALFSNRFNSQLPRTIRDAIDLTSAIGERYIWIDALCIIQDEHSAEKSIILRQMDKIYSIAYFTIIAAVGNNADAGLPGLNENNPRRIPQIVLSYGFNRRIAVSQAPFEKWLGNQPLMTQGNCAWNRRGWTLQERLLSCRKLIFLEEGVHFNCDGMTWTEDVAAERQDIDLHFQMAYDFEGVAEGMASNAGAPRKKGEYSLRPGKFDSPNWLDYCNLVSSLTNREFTFENDILKSFQGILSTLTIPFSTFYCGLPERFFSIALLWRPIGFSRRRASELPSWSWAGWTSPIDVVYWRSACDWMKHKDVLDSYRTVSQVVFHSGEVSSAPLLDDWHRYRYFDGQEADAGVENRLPHGWSVRTDLEPYHFLGRNRHAFFCVHDDPNIQFFHPIPIIPFRIDNRTGHTLQFRSETAVFTVSFAHNVYTSKSNSASILDSHGEWCGVVDLNEELSELNPQNAEMEFVKISAGEVSVGCMKERIFTELEVLDRASLPSWYRYVNVVMLRNLPGNGSGSNERVGVGRISESAWSDVDTCLRNICLV